jgi:hypothetical protein
MFRIGLTTKEKPRKRQSQLRTCIPDETTRQTEKNKQRNSKKHSNHKINDNF